MKHHYPHTLMSLICLPFLAFLLVASIQPLPWKERLASYTPPKNHSFVVIVPSFNNEQWVVKNLDSITQQYKSYPFFRVIYIDDASTDGTVDTVVDYIKTCNPPYDIQLVRNKKNQGGLANLYSAIHQYCNDHEICIEVDGDDWLQGDSVFATLNKVYSYTDCWLTYGQYQEWPSGKASWRRAMSITYTKINNFRGNWGWFAPLRSWYAWLFKKIDRADLTVNLPTHPAHGTFFPYSWDHAMMWPMAEMATEKHITFMPDVTYIYNKANPLTDSLNTQEQYSFVDYLCDKKQKRYSPIAAPPTHTAKNTACGPKPSTSLAIGPHARTSADDQLWQRLKTGEPTEEKHIVVLVPSFNNKDWYQKNLDSIFKQDYQNYTIHYYDDCSTDGTSELVMAYAKEKGQASHVVLHKNTHNKGGLANIYDCCTYHAKPTDIIVEVDGDDWLTDKAHIFRLLNTVYENPDVWFTYGQFTNWPDQPVDAAQPVPAHIIASRKYRGRGWEKPLRSWRAWLFQAIKKTDLQHQERFFATSWDHAFMLPFFEMANGRFMFIPDVLYVYNRANSISDGAIRKQQQGNDARIIHGRKPYAPLPQAPLQMSNESKTAPTYGRTHGDPYEVCTLSYARTDNEQ